MAGSRASENDRIVMKIAREVENALKTTLSVVLRSPALQRVKRTLADMKLQGEDMVSVRRRRKILRIWHSKPSIL